MLIFFTGAFVGYLYEVIFYCFTDNAFINRGVLYGPWLPIYGVGAIVLLFLKPLKKNPLFLFSTMMLITGIIEYIAGYILLNFFDMRLWDYRELFLNIDGFICLRSLLTFAIGGVILIYLVEPIIEKVVAKQSKTLNITIIALIFLFIVDTTLSILFRTPHS
ncbi:MAG: putative ABC transporter permease [Campylobacteraceae bacterium]|nr:putative ABC transporter permease [Campylobacteraceae bacterium]